MKLIPISRPALIIGVVALTNCSSMSDDRRSSDGTMVVAIKDAEARIRTSEVFTPLSATEAVDGDGRVWTLVGPIEIGSPSSDPPVMPDVSNAADNQVSLYLQMTDEELADKIRPVRVAEGLQYILRDLPIEAAHQLREWAAAGQVPPESASNEGYGGGSEPSLESGLSQRTILHSPEARYHQPWTNNYPYRATGSLNQNGCTGFFIGPRTILTAAHCLFAKAAWPPGAGTWRPPVTFTPGKDNSFTPWGVWTVSSYYLTNAYIAAASVQDGYPWDYAIVNVNIASGYTGAPGWLGLATYDQTNNAFQADGYPAGPHNGNEQWHSYAGGVYAFFTTDSVYHNVDLSPGDSGSALYHAQNGDPYKVVGVNVAEGSQLNRARGFDSVLRQFIYDTSPVFH